MKNNRSRTFSLETPEQLLETLRHLVSETEKLLGDTSEQAEEKMEDIRSRIENARESFAEFFDGTKEKLSSGVRQADETIRSHPYESLAVILGIGVLLGALIRRSD
ncbi:MAG: DUF883 domain-containing protein [Verrucomicrobiota bacterium]|nr:DUF883 domain-containing protein [Verrucomicrobiota bacterium]